MTKHFMDFDDYSYETLQKIIDSAVALKAEHISGVVNNSLVPTCCNCGDIVEPVGNVGVATNDSIKVVALLDVV